MASPFGNVEVFARQTKFKREPFATITPHGAQWLVKGLLPAQGYGFLAGPSQGGKSFLALDWSLRIAAGKEVLERRLGLTGCGVVYVASEGANGVRKRVKAWRDANRVDPAMAFEMIGEAPDLANTDDIDDLMAELRAASAELSSRGQRLGLVVIDTLAASMPGGNENDGADMSRLLGNVQRLGKDLGAFILIVSHTGKDETRGLRGWSGQFAGAEVVVMITREEGADLRVGEVKKQKDGEAGQRFAFTLTQAVIGQDDDGDDVTSALVSYTEAPDPKVKARRNKALSNAAQVVLGAVKYVTDNGATRPPPPAPGVQGWMLAVVREDVKARAMTSGLAGEDDKPAAIRQRFGRALEELVAAKQVRQEGGLIWLLS